MSFPIKDLAPLIGTLMQLGILKAGCVNTAFLSDAGCTLVNGIAFNLMNVPREPENDDINNAGRRYENFGSEDEQES